RKRLVPPRLPRIHLDPPDQPRRIEDQTRLIGRRRTRLLEQRLGPLEVRIENRPIDPREFLPAMQHPRLRRRRTSTGRQTDRAQPEDEHGNMAEGHPPRAYATPSFARYRGSATVVLGAVGGRPRQRGLSSATRRSF